MTGKFDYLALSLLSMYELYKHTINVIYYNHILLKAYNCSVYLVGEGNRENFIIITPKAVEFKAT